MCGITGFFARTETTTRGYYDAHLALRHRGPDDEGFAAIVDGRIEPTRGDDSVGDFSNLRHVREVSATRLMLGHRRLAIIDLTACGHEPFADATGDFQLLYNGELFNYLELREELRALGHHFRTDSDTEVVLEAFIEWGVECFRRFNGMWGVVIYDRRRDELVLARDRFGIKPMYWSDVGGVLYFGSELKFFESLLGDALILDQDAVRGYVERALLNSGTYTFWSQVRELRPAHWMRVTRAGDRHEGRFWDFEPHPVARTEAEAVEEFGRLFDDSLRLRMRSDVEVGTLLSGGLDSTLVVAELARLGFIDDGNFKTFSADFPEKQFSERSYIEETLRQVPVTPYFVEPQASEVVGDLDTLLKVVEEPFRSLSVYSQYLLYRTVKTQSGVTVLLNGQGADELFGGYVYHYYFRMAEMARRLQLGELAATYRGFRADRGIDARTVLWTTLKRFVKSLGTPDYFNRGTFPEITTTSLREYLRYDDRTSMSWSLESRVPFLDYRLVEFAFTLSSDMKIDRSTNKRVEREFARGIVPDSVVNRRDKMGFVSPQELWQRAQLAPALEQSAGVVAEICASGMLADGAAEQRRYTEYLAGRSEQWDRAWRLFCLARWLTMHGRI